MSHFTTTDIPDLTGRTTLVTGATGGLGFETARMLSGRGATVILAGRNRDKGAKALQNLEQHAAQLSFEPLDLADLASIRSFAERVQDRGPIDILVNNAGVMAPPQRQQTSDGFELQLGTNHLGHFALTGALLGQLRGHNARVVSVSSIAASSGSMNFDDLQSAQAYQAWGAYGQSKLANLLFARELQRRSDEGNWDILSVAAHPGFANTDLISNGPGGSGFGGRIASWFGALFGQSASDGAMPIVYAATMPDVARGDYFGPAGVMGLRGPTKRVKQPDKADNDATARRLWQISEDLTGIRYEAAAMGNTEALS